jgi:hypothetical protein
VTLKTFLTDLGTYLQTNSIGTVGTDLFYNGLDESVSNCIALTPFPGKEFKEIVSAGVNNPRQTNLSVLVRNSSSELAYSKAVDIYELLRVIANQIIGTTKFISIDAHAPPGFVTRDDSKNFIFSVNFSLLIQ